MHNLSERVRNKMTLTAFFSFDFDFISSVLVLEFKILSGAFFGHLKQRRRDRINEKMRALQELIPNCNKVDMLSNIQTNCLMTSISFVMTVISLHVSFTLF